MKSITPILVLSFGLVRLQAASITYQGTDGPGRGKHIVFLASDHEYRAEETSPALARILAKNHGFKCTVVFGVDDKGFIKAGSSDVSGLVALDDADLFVIFARFLNPPDEEMAHIDAYLERGGPVVGLRTASHAFKIPTNSRYAQYDFQSKIPDYEGGFGQKILGNTWVGHYGENHVQGTRIQIIKAQKDHVILTGVEDNAFCYAGAYVGIPGPGFTALTESQPLITMEKDSNPVKSKQPSLSSWIRHYTTQNGKQNRVFHSTQGASEDILDENYRRLIINGIFWAAGLEAAIKPDLDIDFVGPYKPNTFSFNGNAQNVKPSDLGGWESPIMPQGNEHTPVPAKDN